MNPEFKRMIELAGLTEIKVNPPAKPLAIGQRYNMKHEIFEWEEIEITDLGVSSFGTKIVDYRSVKHPSPFGDSRLTMEEWYKRVKNRDIVPL